MTEPESQDVAGQTRGGPASGAGAVATVLASAEVAIAAYVLAAYGKWLTQVIAKVLAGFVRFGVGPDPGAIWSTVPLWERLVDGLEDRLKKIARAGWISAAESLGLDLPWNPDDPLLVDALARTRNLMVRTPDEVYRQILEELGRSVAAGETVQDQAARVRHVLDVTGTENWPARARTVAVTEVHRTWNFGALAASMRAQMQLQRQLTKTWIARDDSAARPGHKLADGQTVPINQPFIVNMEALMMPGDPAGSPSNVINCVPGDTQISVTGIQKGFRYPYSGRMLSITRKHGGISTVSPNHPVLTERGWVAARQLNQGDNLVCTGNLFVPLIVDPDVESAPPIAKEIYDALMLSDLGQRVVGMPMDFHGDGSHGDIYVVLSNGELTFGVGTLSIEFFKELCLTFADAPDASDGALDQLLLGTGNTPDSVMGFGHLAQALLGAHEIPLADLCLTVAPDGDSQGSKSGNKGGTRNPGPTGKRVRTISAKVFLDEILEIRDFFFEGHLFTFETNSGVYVADGIVSHNCRCKPLFRRSR